jgi:nitrate reductase gamma subunit
MNVNYMYSLIAVLFLCLLSYVGAEVMGLQGLFGIWIPYLAVIIFVVGFVVRVLGWAKSPVPFAIPTTCGQQKTLSWIEPNWIDNPTSKFGVLIRMILEVFLFRSLFRNTSMSFNKTDSGVRISYRWEIWLWVAALAFHYSFLTVLIRHLRFFLEPVPLCIQIVEKLDSFFRIEFFSPVIEVGLPGFFLSGLVLLAAVTFLFLRRVFGPKVKYISLAADYFPLFLIMGIACTGILMRYFAKIDIVSVKALAMSLVALHPAIPEGIGGLFFIHIFLVSVLFVYFPFSKLMHMGGVFLSPTRNLTTDTRARRHVNPWNYPVKTHTYEEYEDHFREKMIEAGLPVEKEQV